MRSVLDVGLSRNDRIGNYRIEGELGPTGTGLLLEAHHLVLPRRAIIKVVHTAFAAVQPFAVQTLREACILEAIAHPGVPAIYESGVLRDRRPWFAFEAISGPTLEELIEPGPLPIVAVAGILRDLAEILELAHRRGVIHRGLRPDRVIVTHPRRFPLCIPDWSEAIAHDAQRRSPIATPSGAESYLAPEVGPEAVLDDDGDAEPSAGATGTEDRVDDRVDMFALGVIAFRALTGVLPFRANARFPHVSAQVLRRDAPARLTSLIDSLLAFDRFDRPSAADVGVAIDWLFATLPELASESVLSDACADEIGSARAVTWMSAAPSDRWTPESLIESTEVDIEVVDDGDLAQQ